MDFSFINFFIHHNYEKILAVLTSLRCS